MPSKVGPAVKISGETTLRDRLINCMLVALISGLYIAFCAHTPISILANAVHDDALFISHGRLLADGHWLGSFSQFTLMKGPGYPAFLALSAWSWLPISITESIFNCIAVGSFCWIIRQLSGFRILAFATFVFVLWNPGLVQQRVLRDAIYPGQLMLFIAALSCALFCVARRRQVALLGSIAGAMLGWFWLTREEGAWILPGATLLVVGGALHMWLRTRTIWLSATATAYMLFVFVLMMVAFRLVNLFVYGRFVGVDIKEPNFQGALEAMQSVEVRNPIPFVPVTAEARGKIYRISPAFASLQKHLDPAGGSPWQKFGCQFYPWTCGEIAGGWFIWALRDAAAAEGFYQSPARASRFFGKVRTQIDSACRLGRLVCRSSPISFMPLISEEQARQIPSSGAKGLSYLLFRRPPPVVIGSSTGPPADLSEASRFLNYPIRTPLAEAPSIQHELSMFSDEQQSWLGRHVSDFAKLSPADSCVGYFDSASSDGFEGGAKVNGWAWASKEKIAPSQILLADDAGTIVGLASGGVERPDVVAVLPGITDRKTGWQGYSKEARSVSAYAVIEGGREACRLARSLDIVLALRASDPADTNATDPRIRLALRFRTFLNSAYGILMPALLLSGLAAIIVATWMTIASRDVDPILVLAGVAWVLMLCRIALLALIDVSSFPAINPPYLAPAYPLSCLAPILSIGSFLGQWHSAHVSVPQGCRRSAVKPSRLGQVLAKPERGR
jgi:hypothetical protein